MRDDGFSTRSQFPGFTGDKAKRTLQPASLIIAPGVDLQHSGQQRDQLLARHMVEADNTAGQVGEFTRAAVTHDLVSIADLLDRYIEQRYHRAVRAATDTVAVAVGNECQAALLQQARFFAFNFEPAVTACDDMKHHVALKGRHIYTPGCGQLGSAVKRTGKFQQVQCFAERVGELRDSGVSTQLHVLYSAIYLASNSSGYGRKVNIYRH